MFYSSSAIQADELASLALTAATEIDKIERGKAAKLGEIRKFADAIAEFSGIDENTTGGVNWLDPTSSEMFSSAVAQTTDRRIADIDTLNDELATLIKTLREDDGGAPQDKLKRFCLSIHDFILRSRMKSGMNERGVFDYEYAHVG